MNTSVARFTTSIGMMVIVAGPACVLSGFQQPSPTQYATPVESAPSVATDERRPEPAESRPSANADAPALATVLLSSPSPTEHEIFRGILPGASREEVNATFPDLDRYDVVASDRGSSASFGFRRDVVDSLEMRISHADADALALAEAHWGSPIEWRKESEQELPKYVWFDPEHELRAVLKQGDAVSWLSIEHYEPVRSLLGEGEELAFEQGRPLLDSTYEELEARFPGSIERGRGNRARLKLPATEHSSSTPVVLNFDARGRVEGYSLDLYCWRQEASAKESIRQLFVEKWGEPKPIHNGNYDLYRARAPMIKVRYDAAFGWGVRVER